LRSRAIEATQDIRGCLAKIAGQRCGNSMAIAVSVSSSVSKRRPAWVSTWRIQVSTRISIRLPTFG